MKRSARILPAALALALLLLPCALHGKSGGRITGKVISKEGQALLGAVVTIFKEDEAGGSIFFTRTDRRGEYNFREVLPGSYSLHVNYEGYKPHVSGNLAVRGGKTTTINVYLLEVLDFFSSDDPRNFGITTVMRSASDRRLIFRALDDPQAGIGDREPEFERNVAVNLVSSTGLSGHGYAVFPMRGYGDMVSNFAYSEPVGQKTRMIFSGQLSAGEDSLWRVRNTYQYQPQAGRDMKFSLGYGRQNMAAAQVGSAAGPSEFFARDPSVRDSGVQTVALGFSSSDQLLEDFAIEYGFDASRIHHGNTRTVFSPHFRLFITPAAGWLFKSRMTSTRLTDANSVVLPDGEIINLIEPVYIAKIDGQLRLSRFRHFEVGVEKQLADATSVELALYQDRVEGPGLPFVMTIRGPASRQARMVQLAEDQAEQRGLRVSVNRSFISFISGSVSYVYGRGATLDPNTPLVVGTALADNWQRYVQRSYVHSLKGSLHTRFDRTKTDLQAIFRWHPDYPLTPIDLFSDREDFQGRGIAVCLRQLIPVPDFLYSAGQWVALVDVRNLFDQGKYVIPTADGAIILTPSPRYLRFGLNLNFN